VSVRLWQNKRSVFGAFSMNRPVIRQRAKMPTTDRNDLLSALAPLDLLTTKGLLAGRIHLSGCQSISPIQLFAAQSWQLDPCSPNLAVQTWQTV
jgi:hypothetical protein